MSVLRHSSKIPVLGITANFGMGSRPHSKLGPFYGCLICIFAILSSNELYQAVSRIEPTTQSWISIGLLHTLVAVVIYLMIYRTETYASLFGNPGWWATPALAIFAISLLAATISCQFGTPNTSEIPSAIALSVLWIPLVEEVVFRLGWSLMFVVLAGPWWGAYFSGILFAMVHTDLSFSSVLAGGAFHLPLGPLFLGWSCEILLRASRSFLAIVLLHMACNTTPIIFALLDVRWLDWLAALYH